MSNKCRINCKYLGYDYDLDEQGRITDNYDVPYKCEKYKVSLGYKAIKCDKCMNMIENRGKVNE